LLDVSSSTSGEKLRHIKECTGMLTEALESIGDPYFIYAFGEHFLYAVKKPLDKSEARKKVWNLEAAGGTPQAEATRDMTSIFNTINAKTKILFTVADGAPNDGKSTRDALLEAKNAGIHPYSITVDPHAEKYLEQLCGTTPYCICTDPAELPQKAGRFYREVAFR
jgi:nitric oxide reductase NorD protein